jgi:hypothetical protein
LLMCAERREAKRSGVRQQSGSARRTGLDGHHVRRRRTTRLTEVRCGGTTWGRAARREATAAEQHRHGSAARLEVARWHGMATVAVARAKRRFSAAGFPAGIPTAGSARDGGVMRCDAQRSAVAKRGNVRVAKPRWRSATSRRRARSQTGKQPRAYCSFAHGCARLGMNVSTQVYSLLATRPVGHLVPYCRGVRCEETEMATVILHRKPRHEGRTWTRDSTT